MSVLTILDEEGMPIGAANPIYLTSDLDMRRGAQITFEVLDADASSLTNLLGQKHVFGIDSQRGLFLARLTELEPYTSTAMALLLLRNRPTLRGVLTVEKPINLDAPEAQA